MESVNQEDPLTGRGPRIFEGVNLPRTNRVRFRDVPNPSLLNGSLNQFYCAPNPTNRSQRVGCGDCHMSRLELEGSKAEILVFQNVNKQLREMLESAERSNMAKDEKIKAGQTGVEELRSLNLELNGEAIKSKRELNQMKGFMNELYFVVGGVLTGMGGTVPQINLSEGVVDAQSLKDLCANLRSQYSLWQESHEFMHSELERAFQIVEALDAERNDDEVRVMTATTSVPQPLTLPQSEETDKDIDESSSAPSLCTVVSTTSYADLGQGSDQVDRSILPGNSSINYPTSERPDALEKRVDQIPCEDCEQGFSSLSRVTSKLARSIKNKKNAHVPPKRKESDQNKADTSKIANASDKNKDQRSSNPNDNADSSEMVETQGLKVLNLGLAINLFRVDSLTSAEKSRRQKLKRNQLVFETDGVEHEHAGVCTVMLPSDQKKSMREFPPLPEKRHFCKCGRSYPDPACVTLHINDIIGKSGSPQ